MIPACYQDGLIFQSLHVMLDQLEPDKLLICIPQNNCGPLEDQIKSYHRQTSCRRQKEHSYRRNIIHTAGQNNYQNGSGFLSGWYWMESLLYAFLISESVAP